MARCGVLNIRHVKAGQHLNDTGQRRRLRNIHGNYFSIRDGAVQNFRDQRRSFVKVIGIFGAPGYLVVGVHSLNASSNLHFVHLRSSYHRTQNIFTGEIFRFLPYQGANVPQCYLYKYYNMPSAFFKVQKNIS
ncbi:hypothetical protein SDC9_113790 [bioreactor metagenome]|uniref:Uncharacterized protein n=1 Tax=bioreactor metagenome TaxID=1076179 RepID=A0A645BP23_9ZZZZ